MAIAARHPIVAEQKVTENAERSYTLPSRYYLAPDIYEREKEAIFYRSWLYAGHASQFARPGDYLAVQVADESVFVLKGDDGRLRGFYNVCRHRAHQLLKGRGNVAGNIVCPYHAWSYSKRGTLEFARNSERVAGFDKSQLCLSPIAVDGLGGLVFINLDPKARPMAEVYPGLEADLRERIPALDELAPAADVTFGPSRIGANWKVVVDNFLECYHCTPAHPDFVTMFDMDRYELDTFPNWSRQSGPVVRPRNTAYDFDPDAEVRSGGFWYVWPATTINFLPGEPNLSPLSIVPIDIETTAFAGHRYALPADSGAREGEQVARSAYIDDVLGPEDAALCESVQRGLRSRAYDQGRLVVDPERSGIAEHGVHQFHRLVLEALEALDR
jgi:choline monooxygenase